MVWIKKKLWYLKRIRKPWKAIPVRRRKNAKKKKKDKRNCTPSEKQIQSQDIVRKDQVNEKEFYQGRQLQSVTQQTLARQLTLTLIHRTKYVVVVLEVCSLVVQCARFLHTRRHKHHACTLACLLCPKSCSSLAVQNWVTSKTSKVDWSDNLIRLQGQLTSRSSGCCCCCWLDLSFWPVAV